MSSFLNGLGKVAQGIGKVASAAINGGKKTPNKQFGKTPYHLAYDKVAGNQGSSPSSVGAPESKEQTASEIAAANQ